MFSKPDDEPGRPVDVPMQSRYFVGDPGHSEPEENDAASGEARSPRLALVGARPLLRECLGRAVKERLGLAASPFNSIGDLLTKGYGASDLIVFLASVERQGNDIEEVAQALDEISDPPRLAILADSENPANVLSAFELGARAYIPTSVTIDVMIEVVRLVFAGGSYCPTSVLPACSAVRTLKQAPACMLTPRESAVLKGLREGRPNKLIALELGLTENTIKVHVHRIMKKLNVRNRTQVALTTQTAQ